MLKQPISMARGQASDIAIKAREVMTNRKVSCELIARAFTAAFGLFVVDNAAHCCLCAPSVAARVSRKS